jgi:hypothetical protein
MLVLLNLSMDFKGKAVVQQRYICYNVGMNRTAYYSKNKRTVAVSAELHALLKNMAHATDRSIEQTVNAAMVSYAKASDYLANKDTYDDRWLLVSMSNMEMQRRYYRTRSERSKRMREYNLIRHYTTA